MNGDQFPADHELKDAVGIDVGEYVAQLSRNREAFEELVEKVMGSEPKALARSNQQMARRPFLSFASSMNDSSSMVCSWFP